ncbi:c-type cytochrome [Leptothrix discophora]|uniref:Cytochrome c n=1 Tax=Leptothrix discophora TaxID=89 RepID=A0ABT9FXY6_LEPDI|nr:cytochrome c [Leptothrix discophora]MDP4299099.1 cytochrome c [Leptothrix discophora]
MSLPNCLARPTAAALLALACGAALAQGNERGERQHSGADGAVLYHHYCSVCHGDQGNGRSRATAALSTPPRDFTSAAARRDLHRERIIRSVTFGVPGTAMVGWRTQLSSADIEALADHLHRTFIQPGPTATAPATAKAPAAATSPAAATADAISGTRAHGGHALPGPLPAGAAPRPYPDGLQGDAARGAAYYRVNCVACHGERGDGQGPRAYFIRPVPRDFLALPDPSGWDRARVWQAIADGRLGTEMPAWRQVLDAQQIADLAEHVLTRYIQAPRRPATP